MPLPINKKCQHCAFLTIVESREQSCWVEKQCKNRRNYYRSRAKKLESQNKSYAIATGRKPPVEFEIIPDTYRAELILYGKSPNKQKLVKGGVKGMQVVVYQGSKECYKSQIVHTAGMVSADLETLIDQAQEQVRENFDVARWGRIIFLDQDIIL